MRYFIPRPSILLSRRSSASGASEYVAWRAVVRKLQRQLFVFRRAAQHAPAKAPRRMDIIRIGGAGATEGKTDRQVGNIMINHTHKAAFADRRGGGLLAGPGHFARAFCASRSFPIAQYWGIVLHTSQLRELKGLKRHIPSLVGRPWCRSASCPGPCL